MLLNHAKDSRGSGENLPQLDMEGLKITKEKVVIDKLDKFYKDEFKS